MKFAITVGTADSRERSARKAFAGIATRIVEARTSDAALRRMVRYLERRGLRPVGYCQVQQA